MTTILVIDDDEQIQHFLRTVLQGAGYAVVTADNGAKGMQQYRHKQTDLILCDIFMEGQEGLETIRELRRDFPTAKVVAISGGGSVVSGVFLHHAERFGAVATLQKPLERTSLLEIVQKVLRS
jgi:two-component system, chemotaxis family, chemotaxis protein CheY